MVARTLGTVVAVWTYILKRLLLMIPTLFGVTLVTFLVMKQAPGDPVSGQMGGMGSTSGSGREEYLVRKREQRLDKPDLLNVRFFLDYSQPMHTVAYYQGLTVEAIVADLATLSGGSLDAAQQARLDFIRRQYTQKLSRDDFDQRLADPAQHSALARGIQIATQIYCEDLTINGVPPLVEILQSPESALSLRIGALRCLPHMIIDPFVYTYSRTPQESETAQVVSTWRLWWDRNEATFPKLSPAQRTRASERFAQAVAAESHADLFKTLQRFSRNDMRYFAEMLLDEKSSLRQRAVAAQGLRLYIGRPLQTDVSLDADEVAVQQVTENWLNVLLPNWSTYEPSLGNKLWLLVSDTQYAHMVWRLVRFDFGLSAIKTREPVAQRVWDAFKVSAPMMLISQLVIYLVAVPTGILCAVHRGRLFDRLMSLALFLLYSIPPYVAAMMLLLLFCYGDYLQWFPMMRLHSADADQLSWPAWLLDYAHHAFLPVVCLSLFSLAAMAMFSRSAMLDVIGQDFIRTARAKGVSERKVIWKHALRNALIPIITLFANFLPAMLGGSVLIEVIFGIPGIGRLSYESIDQKDYPMVMALIYIDAIVVMLSILLSDLLYVVADPRISFDSQGGHV